MKCQACKAKLVFVRGAWVCSKEFAQYIADSTNFVSFARGRKKGVITDCRNGYFSVSYHNGIKIAHDLVPVEKTKQISREEILEYSRKRGDTSMYELICKY